MILLYILYTYQFSSISLDRPNSQGFGNDINMYGSAETWNVRRIQSFLSIP